MAVVQDYEKKAAALAEGLGKLVKEDRRPAGREKKGDLVLANKDHVVALKAKGWTWADIAQEFARLGFQVSARTLREKIVGDAAQAVGEASASKKKRRKSPGSTAHRRVAKPAEKRVSPKEIKDADEAGTAHLTEGDFVDLREVEN
jgi:hypothetical protein